MADGEPITELRIRKWAATIGRTRVASLLRIASALWGAKCEVGLLPDRARRSAELYRRALRVAFRDPLEIADLAVDGDDLRSIGVAPGPLVGKILQLLLDAVLEDPSRNTRDTLLELAADALRRLSPPGTR